MKKNDDDAYIGDMHNPPHPGEVLKDMYLVPLELTIAEAAKRLSIDRKTLSRVVNGKASITVEMALRLGKSLGTSAKVWLGMQQSYDLWHAKQKIDLSNVQGLHTVIVKNKEGKIIADYPVCLTGLNYKVTASEYIEEAKENLIEDAIVKKSELNSLTYELR